MLGPQWKRNVLPPIAASLSITQCPNAPRELTSFALCEHGRRSFPVATRGEHRRPHGPLHDTDGNGYGGRVPAAFHLPGLLL